MKIGILTSSRADYGIYLPLLRKLHSDPFFNLEMLVFGTHLSKRYGQTIDQILSDGFPIGTKIFTAPEDDAAHDISVSMARTMEGFSGLWKEKAYDLVFALGDRYEMFAAVASTVPFNLPVAHIHGGEETLGAIDNVFRHSITCMSKIHFTSTEPYMKKVVEITGSELNVHNVGALSIDSIKSQHLLSKKEFKEKYGIDLALPTILITFHPETVSLDENERYVHELILALKELTTYQLVITMPNADPKGMMVRKELNEFIDNSTHAVGVENFGSLGYLSCMKHCTMMLGNTSSGFIEAYALRKPVVNLGKRQTGRIVTPNIFNCPLEKSAILQAVGQTSGFVVRNWAPIYGEGEAAEKIVNILKNTRWND